MGKRGYIPFNWENLTEKQQQQLNRQWAKSANQKLKNLEKRGKGVAKESSAYKQAKWFLSKNGRDLFSESQKLTGIALRKNLQNLEQFLNNETNTYRGYMKSIKELLERFEYFTDIDGNKRFNTKDVDVLSFARFMRSKQFKALRSRQDSDRVINDFMDESKTRTYDEIMLEYQDFLNSEITFDEMQERRKRGTIK